MDKLTADVSSLLAQALGIPVSSLRGDEQLEMSEDWDSLAHLDLLESIELTYGAAARDAVVEAKAGTLVELVEVLNTYGNG